MSHEIEAKIKVADPQAVAAALQACGAEFLHELRQVDTYFMDAHKRLRKNDCGLRIRRQHNGGQTSALLTFKGPRSQSRYKSRPEFETAIADPAAMERIFESLGYSKRLTFEKQRRVWRHGGCLVCLDELPKLGSFVEVEGPDENAIDAVLQTLNLHREPHISSGYAALLRQRLKDEQAAETELFLTEQE